MSQLKLFKDSEIFMKNRPSKPTCEQLEKFYIEQANEIISNNWCEEYEKKELIEDLKNIPTYISHEGYEICKHLELYGNCDYNIDSDMVSYFDFFYRNIELLIRKNVKEWIIAHNIKPQLELLTEVLYKNENFFITDFRYEEGKYVINKDKTKLGIGKLVNYELIETDRISKI